MTGERADETAQRGMGMKRRGILASIGAVVAGFVAKGTSQPARAATDTNFVAHSGTGTAFHNDTATYDTGVAVSGTSTGLSAVGIALTRTGVSGVGSTGDAREVGVLGQCQYGTDVQGLAPNTSGAANTVAVQGVWERI